MNRLLEYTKDFQCSEPIFKLSVSKDRSEIHSELLNEPVSPSPIEGDVLSELVCYEFSQSFNLKKKVFEINLEHIAEKAMASLRHHMRSLVEWNLDTKAPKQSKLYRWMRSNMEDTDAINSGLLLLYKYARQNGFQPLNINLRIKHDEHLRNILLILEAMREKYERRDR